MKLELRNLSCGYRADRPLVQGLNLVLNGGEVCCVLGPNGVGKTTLFKTILNLEKPLSGQICIDGEDTSRWKPQKMSRYIAYVAQAHIPIYPYTVAEVATMGRMGQIRAAGQPSRKDYEIVQQALEDVGLRHMQDRRYTEISGGERQLLMIARALAQRPKLLILDEPTANLDYGNMVLVMQCIRKLAAGGLCLMFTSHMPDQAFMTGAKTALILPDAPVVFGDAEAVITEKNLYAAYHTDIQILEVIGYGGSPIKVVAPRFR